MGWGIAQHAPIQSRRYRRIVLLCALLLVLAASSALSSSALTVEWKNERLSVVAEDVPLARVLHEIADQTGVTIQGRETLRSDISITLSRMPLGEALDRLLVHVNYLTIDEPPSHGRTQPVVALLVFGEKMAAPSQQPEHWAPQFTARSATDEGALEESPRDRERLSALEGFARQGDIAALRIALFDPAPLIHMRALTLLLERDTPKTLDFLISTTKSNDPVRRLQALEMLYTNGLVNPSVSFEDAVNGRDIVPLEHASENSHGRF
jgi:hypothetical protein